MINRILMTLCLVLAIITSCGGQETPGVQTTTPTLTASDTPTQLQGSFPVHSLTGEMTEFATFDKGFDELTPGTYMLVRERNDIYYYSLEGLHLGKVVSLEPTAPSFSNDAFYYQLSDNLQSPLLQVVNFNNGDQIFLPTVDLKTGETRVWQADIGKFTLTRSSILCEGWTRISPSGRWLAGGCKSEDGQYIYWVDSQNGVGKLIYPSPGPCQSASISDSTWWVGGWSPDEAWLFVYCQPGRVIEGESRGCLISMQSQEFTACRDPFYDAVISWSPDGSKLAMESRTKEFFYDENTQFYVTDVACLTDVEACVKYISIDIHKNPRTWSYIWNNDSNSLIWAQYPLLSGPPGFAGTLDGYTEIGISEISSGTTRIISQGPKGSIIRDLSPDGKWLIMVNDEDLMILSINGQVFRRLPKIGEWPPYFLGWMEIP